MASRLLLCEQVRSGCARTSAGLIQVKSQKQLLNSAVEQFAAQVGFC